ncbi:hypothetical protein AAZX31_09G072500 [Glycine max]
MLIVQEILAQMKNVDVQLKNVIFDVGHTYVIQNFEVEKNIGHYKATRHGFKINFVKETKVTPHEIPKTMYNFTMFDDIVSGSAYTNFLIGTTFEYLINEQLYMLVSLFSLMLVFL